jgi:hypothetical protein
MSYTWLGYAQHMLTTDISVPLRPQSGSARILAVHAWVPFIVMNALALPEALTAAAVLQLGTFTVGVLRGWL